MNSQLPLSYARFISFLFPLLLLVQSCSTGSTGEENAAPLPNIVFILTDDQGWGDLSINGNTNLSTPNIDQLARNGATFERFYVNPVCSPTRAEILTGRYHVRGGVYSTSAGGERLDLDETTIAEVFQRAGYKTGAFGKWHNGMQHPYHPNARGFEEYYGFCSGHWGNYFSPLLEHNGDLIKGNGFVIDDFTDQAMAFMERHRAEPFFVYLPYNTPHSPMQVPDQWWDKFKDKELEMRYREPEKEDLNFTRAALAMCENIDWNVGRILEKLQALELEENTIIVYLSDNGPNGWRWNGGMKGRKGSTDEGGVRSPLLLQWKGKVGAGKRIPQIASTIDFLPTLAELAGIEYQTNKPVDGKSLEPLLLEENPEWGDRFVYNYWRNKLSIRSQQYRLSHEEELFDMVNDPGQMTNIAADQPEVVQELLKAKVAWEKEVLSEMPEVDTRTFPIGHPDYPKTQIPARDAKVTGNLERSNRYPNCSFYSNWISKTDSIYWDAEVLESGTFEAVVYYSCSVENVGATFELSFENSKLQGKITEAHDPPLVGMEEDRSPRIESYVKDFKPLNLGTIALKKGEGRLSLTALDIPGEAVMDFRLLMLNRVVE